MTNEERKHAFGKFIYYLQGLLGDEEQDKNKAALAEMRRGLAYLPQIAPNMHRYILPHMPDGIRGWEKQTYFLIASLFAYHQNNKSEWSNMGTHFKAALDPSPEVNNDGVERRFSALLAAHPDDLHYQLRQAITFLKSRQEVVPINWYQLMWDIYRWQYEEARFDIQDEWATQFWQRSKADSPQSEKTAV